jgi:hypothetical protein
MTDKMNNGVWRSDWLFFGVWPWSVRCRSRWDSQAGDGRPMTDNAIIILRRD